MGDYASLIASATRYALVDRERRIGAWIRGYYRPSAPERSLAENTGLRVLFDLANLARTDLFQADGVEDALVNVLARTLGNSHRDDTGYSTSYLASAAALAFAAAGNFPSAMVLALSALRTSDLQPFEHWMMRVLSDRRIRLSSSGVPGGFRTYAELTDRALSSGLSQDFVRAGDAFLEACRESYGRLVASDKGLLLLWEKVHARLHELSVARVLREIGFPHQGYVARLLGSHSLFYPSQAHALLNYPLTQLEDSVFISLPTSTGKSLLGELALVASLRWQPIERWLAVYVAPYRALTTQILEGMRGRLRSADIACDMRQGGYLSEEPLSPGRPTVLIATPEAFDGMLRKNTDLYGGLAACVFDEFHLIEQQQRGLHYEGLVGRLLSGAGERSWPKIVALSAVVEDTADLEAWLRTSGVVRDDWKPTGRRIAIAYPDRRIQYYAPDETPPGTTEADLLWQGHLAVATVDVVAVAIDQFRRFNGEEPVLIVANTRRESRRIAEGLRRSLDPVSPDSAAYEAAERVIRRYPYLYTLHECLTHGVAYHNAALPYWVRSEIEHLLPEKRLRFVVSTTTLAEGVDFPFRVVLLADWAAFWQFGESQPMSRLLVRNMSGRAGRAWAHAEGDTILIAGQGGTRQGFAGAFERYIERSTYGLRSSLSRLLTSQSGERGEILADSRAVLESQFVAFLAAYTGEGEVQDEFVASLYANREQGARQEAQAVTSALVEDMTVEAEPQPVMVRHSSLALTPFGEALLRTGLSPRSGVALASFITQYVPARAEHDRRRARYNIRWEPLIAGLWERLSDRTRTWIRELEGDRFRPIGSRGFPVRRQDFCTVAMAWVSGVPMELIGYMTWRRRRGQIASWLSGEDHSPPTAFEEWVEQISAFCWEYLSRQWSWVFRGGAEISRYLQNEALAVVFEELASRLELGVSSVEVAQWLRQKCPLDRARLDALKRGYDEYCSGQLPLFGRTFAEWLEIERPHLVDSPVGPFPRIRIHEQDLASLQHFLRSHSTDDE